MATKTLGHRKNNRYLWERGHIIINLANIEVRKRSGGRLERRDLELKKGQNEL